MEEKFFNTARDFAEYLIKENKDTRTFPDFLRELYFVDTPLRYLFKDMYDKYIRGKSIFAYHCAEFQEAEQKAIDCLEEELLKHGYDLSIIYTCELDYWVGMQNFYKVSITKVAQQMQFEI